MAEPQAHSDERPPLFQMSSDVWPGLVKLGEECTEVAQVVLKIVATGGTMRYADGRIVERERLLDEMGDVLAALTFVMEHNLTDADLTHVDERARVKGALYEEWRRTEGGAW